MEIISKKEENKVTMAGLIHRQRLSLKKLFQILMTALQVLYLTLQSLNIFHQQDYVR